MLMKACKKAREEATRLYAAMPKLGLFSFVTPEGEPYGVRVLPACCPPAARLLPALLLLLAAVFRCRLFELLLLWTLPPPPC
jgi:hypothetical protein